MNKETLTLLEQLAPDLMEKLMLDVMFLAPERKGNTRCTITAEVVRGEAEPKLERA